MNISNKAGVNNCKDSFRDDMAGKYVLCHNLPNAFEIYTTTALVMKYIINYYAYSVCNDRTPAIDLE